MMSSDLHRQIGIVEFAFSSFSLFLAPKQTMPVRQKRKFNSFTFGQWRQTRRNEQSFIDVVCIYCKVGIAREDLNGRLCLPCGKGCPRYWCNSCNWTTLGAGSKGVRSTMNDNHSTLPRNSPAKLSWNASISREKSDSSKKLNNVSGESACGLASDPDPSPVASTETRSLVTSGGNSNEFILFSRWSRLGDE